MCVYIVKEFARFCKNECITDEKLIAAFHEIVVGKFDASLCSEVFKQRIARPGGGKSGGYRAIVFFRSEHRTIFAHGFAKSDRETLSPEDLKGLRAAAKQALNVDDHFVANLVGSGVWLELEI
jgi:hypothetical protein